eukprot:TCONS_00002526-protein
MKLMQLCYDRFYKQSSQDVCTLGADKVLINRRNLTTEVKRRVSATKNFLHLELRTRIVAATMKCLGIDDIDPIPDSISQIETTDKVERKRFLENLCAEVVDKFVLVSSNTENFLTAIQAKSQKIDGKFKCNFEKCDRMFLVNGKAKFNHEKTVHGLHEGENISDDQKLNYQTSLMEYLMLWHNFNDSVSEGDGDRLLRCWKFVLPYFYNEGSHSQKYCVEAAYLIIQVNSLLSQRQAHSLIWNRFVKNKGGKGGNIPLDLEMEHYIRLVKNIRRRLGPNALDLKIMDRYVTILT